MHRCHYCGYTGFRSDFEIDHVIPQARVPLIADLLSNLELICSGCNRQKGIKTRSEYQQWRNLFPMLANFGPINEKG